MPEIADSPADIDAAMRLGFGSEMGPFEIWDAIGVQRGIDMMREREIAVAPWVEAAGEIRRAWILWKCRRTAAS